VLYRVVIPFVRDPGLVFQLTQRQHSIPGRGGWELKRSAVPLTSAHFTDAIHFRFTAR